MTEYAVAFTWEQLQATFRALDKEWASLPPGPDHDAAVEAVEKLKHVIREEHRWASQDHPCTGPGYAHEPHGKCPGYGSDRT